MEGSSIRVVVRRWIAAFRQASDPAWIETDALIWQIHRLIPEDPA